jgi:hypothetical protein
MHPDIHTLLVVEKDTPPPHTHIDWILENKYPHPILLVVEKYIPLYSV